MAKKKTSGLGANALDVLDAPASPPAPSATDQTPAASRTPTGKRRGPDRDPVTFRVRANLLAEARGAAVALAGPPVRLTLTDLVENALRAELERLRAAHNGGHPFPPFGTLVGGRPIGS